MNTTGLLDHIEEREAIRRRREAGQSPPLTNNPIYRAWSFTNVRREDDRVSRWIAVNWREPHADNLDLFFAMTVARFINWPDTLAELGFPVPWPPDRFLAVMAARAGRGDKLYGDAYQIHADPLWGYPTTAEYQEAEVFTPMWRSRKSLRPTKGETLAHYHQRLAKLRGFGGGFMGGQFGDLKYVEPLASASDWMTFAVSGPGSRRGLNRIYGRPIKTRWSEAEWRTAFEKAAGRNPARP